MARTYEDWDDDSFYEVEEPRRKSKPKVTKTGKGKGHQSKHTKHRDGWAELEISLEEVQETKPIITIPEKPKTVAVQKPTPQKPVQIEKPVQNQPSFVPGPNSHNVKNTIIDFDRVQNIEKVENEYNGKITYGIKFSFLGKKGLSRIVWFNNNFRERDSVYNHEFSFWKNLPQSTK